MPLSVPGGTTVDSFAFGEADFRSHWSAQGAPGEDYRLFRVTEHGQRWKPGRSNLGRRRH